MTRSAVLRYSTSEQTSAGFHKTRDSYLRMKGFIRIDPERCKGCSWCMEHCPNHAIVLSNRLNLKGYFVADFADEQGVHRMRRVRRHVPGSGH